MIPKWFCPGVGALLALALSEVGTWLGSPTLLYICLGAFFFLGGISAWLMYQEHLDEKRRKFYREGKP